MAASDAWKQFPELQSERLRLRQIDPEADAAAYFEGISTVSLPIWTSMEKESLEKTKRRLEFDASAFRRKSVVSWGIALREQNTIIGYARLSEFENQTKAELAYWLNERYRRQGLMSEALRTVVGFAFGQLGLHRIQAYVRDDNIASQQLLLSLGFTEEGLLRKYQLRSDGWADMRIYAMLREDWQV